MANEKNKDLLLNNELDECQKFIDEIDSSNEPQASPKLQALIRSTIDNLENLTRQVSDLGLFGKNEELSELPTSSIRFLLLPASLGYLTEKLTSNDRKELLDAAEIYFKDFLIRLKSYNIISSLFWIDEDNDASDDSKFSSSVQPKMNSNAIREEKIRRFHQQKELKATYDSLRKGINYDIADDETLRQLYITELEVWANTAEDMLHNIEKEKPLLHHMTLVKSGQVEESRDQPAKQAPLKPIIITRNALQKKIFGLGYPSLPAMTIEEFFEQKRLEGQVQITHNQENGDQKPMTEEDEKILKEIAAENENKDLIKAERDQDEYKDDHRRGWGSNKNKG